MIRCLFIYDVSVAAPGELELVSYLFRLDLSRAWGLARGGSLTQLGAVQPVCKLFAPNSRFGDKPPPLSSHTFSGKICNLPKRGMLVTE